jgi:hypothetical protein
VNPIRPSLASSVQPNTAARPADAARSAAQKAFFEIALGKTPAAAAAAPVQASVPAAAAPVQRTPQAVRQGETPARPLRPGSLVDIRV